MKNIYSLERYSLSSNIEFISLIMMLELSLWVLENILNYNYITAGVEEIL